MSTTTDALSDVVSTLKAGESFYSDAKEKANSSELKSVFAEMERTRKEAIGDLEHFIEKRGDDAPSASWSEQAKASYTSAMEFFKDRDNDASLLAKLEEHEDRTFEAFRGALNDVKNDEARSKLNEHLQTFQDTHARMKSLKDQHVDA